MFLSPTVRKTAAKYRNLFPQSGILLALYKGISWAAENASKYLELANTIIDALNAAGDSRQGQGTNSCRP
jgi:hypothetical protein